MERKKGKMKKNKKEVKRRTKQRKGTHKEKGSQVCPHSDNVEQICNIKT
jgi:hypothetical protein